MSSTPVVVLDSTLTDIADAIRGKNGSSDTYKPSEMSTAITAIPSGGGDIVNGIISRFKATSGTVDANTFVEFVNTITPGTDTSLVATSNAYYNISAVLVDDNKVFIAHRSGNYLYGIICTISGSTITPGTDTQLSTATDSYQDNSPVLVDTNKIFIAHRGANYHLNGLLCTISDTSITVDADIELSSTSMSFQYASAVRLDTNKVFISYKNGNYLDGMVCTISGTTITPGSSTRLIATSNVYKNASAVLVDANKVFVLHTGASNNDNYLNGVVCTISGTTITPGTDTQIATGTYAAIDNSLALVETNKVFIIYRSGDYLNGVVCTISGTTITPGGDTQLTTTAGSYDDNSLALVEPNRFFIVHEISNYLYGMVCTISGTTITAGTDTRLTSSSSSITDYAKVVRVGTDKVFIAHRGTSNYLYGMVCTAPEITVQAATSQFSVGGITKTACTGATEGEVWVLN